MGIITTKKGLVQLEKLSTSAFCRRRLSVVMVRLKMAETLKEACTLIEQVGHCLCRRLHIAKIAKRQPHMARVAYMSREHLTAACFAA